MSLTLTAFSLFRTLPDTYLHNSPLVKFIYIYPADEGSASGDDKEPEREYSQPAIHPPGQVIIGTGQVPAKQVACGLHHTGKFYY